MSSTEKITICVNGKDVQVAKATEIDYRTLCQLANISVESRPSIAYTTGPMTVGMVEYGQAAPLKRHAAYSVASHV